MTLHQDKILAMRVEDGVAVYDIEGEMTAYYTKDGGVVKIVPIIRGCSMVAFELQQDVDKSFAIESLPAYVFKHQIIYVEYDIHGEFVFVGDKPFAIYNKFGKRLTCTADSNLCKGMCYTSGAIDNSTFYLIGGTSLHDGSDLAYCLRDNDAIYRVWLGKNIPFVVMTPMWINQKTGMVSIVSGHTLFKFTCDEILGFFLWNYNATDMFVSLEEMETLGIPVVIQTVLLRNGEQIDIETQCPKYSR